MKKLLLLPVFALTVLVANAQAPTTSGVERQNGPVMKFDELEFNFGTIKQGESVTHEFRFKNAGKEPLLINNAVGSCGCTVPDYPKEPIKPNSSGVIKVTFNSAGKSGPQDKTVTITYDTDKTIVLHMKGTVEVPTATPAQTAPAPAPATDKKDAPVVTPKSTTPAAPAQKAPAPAPKVVATPAPAPASAEKKDAAPAPVEAKPKN